MSLTAYAKRRGVSTVAVSKAIAAGRLTESVVRDARGGPKIADPEMADREWDENTRAQADQGATAYQQSRAAREAMSLRRETAEAELAEIELAERRGTMIPAAQARRDVMERYTAVKTKLLGVPRRIAQRFPHIAEEVVPVLDEVLREALEELASGGRTE